MISIFNQPCLTYSLTLLAKLRKNKLYYSFLFLIYKQYKKLHMTFLFVSRKDILYLNASVEGNQITAMEVTPKKWRPKTSC